MTPTRTLVHQLKYWLQAIEDLDRDTHDEFVREALSLVRRSVSQLELYLEKTAPKSARNHYE